MFLDTMAVFDRLKLQETRVFSREGPREIWTWLWRGSFACDNSLLSRIRVADQRLFPRHPSPNIFATRRGSRRQGPAQIARDPDLAELRGTIPARDAWYQ